MEIALLNYFVLDDDLRSSCDFNPSSLYSGISIYEVIRVQYALPLFLELHIKRFYASAKLENLEIPFDSDLLKHRLKALIETNQLSQGNIKFLFHKSKDGIGHFMAWVMPFFYPSDEQYREGVKVELMKAKRPRPNAKKAMYQLREKADTFIHEKACFEVVYYNAAGWVTEGSRSNVFFVKDSQIITPEKSMVLPGVTRERVMELATELEFTILETKIKLKQLPDFDACFLTGTSPKILPIYQLHSSLYSIGHPIVTKLMAAYDAHTESYLKKFNW